jgi:metallo-beta-lactamase family protein
VYLDSPLAIAVTEIYKRRIDLFNQGVREEVAKGDDVFNFPGLRFTRSTEESKMINEVSGPKIVIAGAGMSHGGRIQHHEIRYLNDPKNALLLIGYQAAGSIGRLLQDGARHVTILGNDVPVRAQIATLSGYSAHKDRDGLIEYASHFKKGTKRVFVTMGEPRSSLFLVQRLRDYLGLNAVAPKLGDRVSIEL